MTEPFDLRFDPAASLIEVTMRGFWTVDDVDRYAAAMRALAVPLLKRRQWFGIVVDNTAFVVQSSAVSEALIAMMRPRGTETAPPPTALIVAGALSRLQGQRIAAAGANTVVVESRAEALDRMATQAPAGWRRPAR